MLEKGMRTFADIREQFSREPVQLAGMAGNGVLRLDGADTCATLTSSKWNKKKRYPGGGWFDVVLQQSNGSKILLHNALTVGSTPYGCADEISIFPNIVVLNAEHILPTGNIREITFTARGLEDIFFYEIAEWQSLYRAPAKVLNSLRDLRRLERPYPRQYDFFRPGSVYLVHDVPRVLQVRVEDRTYSVSIRRSEPIRGNSLTISAEVIATIRFDQPVSIDAALEAVWAWRNFFAQIAMRPFPFLSISCRAKTQRTALSSDLYLPNLGREIISSSPHMFDFGPAGVPYGEWKHRRKFSEVMQTWLGFDSKRRLFRTRVNQVLEKMRSESSPALVAQLCAAVESLTELQTSAELKKSDLDAIVAAASAAANCATPPIPRERIEGILGMLKHESLPQRLRRLAADIEHSLSRADAKVVIRNALRLRTLEAHGGGWDEMTIPLLKPTLEALVSICVLWDLASSGMPGREGNRYLTAASRLAFNAKGLGARNHEM